MRLFIIYAIIINVLSFASMGIDKRRAIKHAYRIPEKTLFFLAAIGGSIGSIAGMQIFRHKTLHKSFVFGMPAILVLHLAIIIGILFLI